MCAAPVRTLAHWASLCVYSNSFIPGEKPKLVYVKEQRVTAFLVHLAILVCLKAKFVLKLIPIPVLFGIFLYFGIVSLSGTQLFERIKFIFTPFKYCPNIPYAKGVSFVLAKKKYRNHVLNLFKISFKQVRPSKRNLFTLFQIAGVAILLAFKSYAFISYFFPVILVLLVPFRRFVLPKIFTSKELEQVIIILKVKI